MDINQKRLRFSLLRNKKWVLRFAGLLILIVAITLTGCSLFQSEEEPTEESTPTAEAEANDLAPSSPEEIGNEQIKPVQIIEYQPDTSAERGNLVVVFSDTNNNAPISQATIVLIESESKKVVDTGTSVSGIYRTAVPPGLYDINTINNTIPISGLLWEGILVEQDKITTLTTFVIP